jgi:ABC-type multidrug transport system ATPase subunit
MPASLLSLVDIEVRRGMGVVLSGFNLEVASKDVVVLHGENGAGKSTVIESCARLLPLERGSILHHGSLVVDSEGRRSLAKQPFGLTLQSNGLLGDETVENHLSTVCSLSGMKTDLLPLLDAYGLAHRRYDRIGQLSGGQARKVAVLAGLLPAMLSREPRLVLLDEPATGLDERALAALISDIGQLREAGHAFLIASHHPEIMKCATRLHDLKSEIIQNQPGSQPWQALGIEENISLLSTRTGHRYLRSTRAGLARNGLTALLVLGALLAFIDPVSLEKSILVGFVLAAPFAAGLAGDPVVYLMREQRAGDWWRAHVNRLPAADFLAPVLGFTLTGLGSILFLDAFNWKISVIGAGVLWATLLCVRFIELSTLRLARPNAVFIRLLLPILILPWALVVEYAATM